MRSDNSRCQSSTRHRVIAVWLLSAVAALPLAAGEIILQVDTLVDSAALTDCLDAVPDDCSLRGAVLTANNVPDGTDVVVELDWETYVLTLDGPLENAGETGDLDVHRSMTIRRALGIPRISGGGAGGLDDRLFDLHGAGTILSLEDITVQNSQPPADVHAINVRNLTELRVTGGRLESLGTLANGGGAVSVAGLGSATFTDTRLWFNAGIHGAAVRSQGQVVFTNTLLRSNVAVDTGAVSLFDGLVSTALFEDCHLDDNDSLGDGAAVWAGSDTILTIRRSVLSANRAINAIDGQGGAIYSRGEVVVEDSTFHANEADRGAAIFLHAVLAQPGQLDLTNSTLSANESNDPSWGAIALVSSDAELLFATSVDQVLDIRVDGNSTLHTSASLFTGGCNFFLGGVLSSGGGNLAPNGICWGGAPQAGDTISSDLDLLPLRNYDGPTPTHLPSATSPALAAVAGPCLATDQRGLPRSAADCTSGAVQRQAIENFLFGDDFEEGDLLAWTTSVP